MVRVPRTAVDAVVVAGAQPGCSRGRARVVGAPGPGVLVAAVRLRGSAALRACGLVALPWPRGCVRGREGREWGWRGSEPPERCVGRCGAVGAGAGAERGPWGGRARCVLPLPPFRSLPLSPSLPLLPPAPVPVVFRSPAPPRPSRPTPPPVSVLVSFSVLARLLCGSAFAPPPVPGHCPVPLAGPGRTIPSGPGLLPGVGRRVPPRRSASGGRRPVPGGRPWPVPVRPPRCSRRPPPPRAPAGRRGTCG